MSYRLEQLLETKCRENPDLAVLRAQWDFDKRLLDQALQSVSSTFPHYSRHDASHSHSVLVQVEKFLGQSSLEKLSATDIWLLLESAFYHDAGMVVTNDKLERIWAEPEFHQHLRGLCRGTDRDLAEAAAKLSSHRPEPTSSAESVPPKLDPKWPLHIVRAVRFVVAEYVRRRHASFGANVVEHPHQIGLASPRTGLIPERLFGWLGRVCLAHGAAFEDVMQLPVRESGIAQDETNPRLIACLLRLGDLLDLDTGRFCPTMLACAGPLPEISQAHVGKHAAIRRLRIDPELIEVEAEFSSDDALSGAYQVCAGWLDMLRSELGRQQEHWNQIAPSGCLRPLPLYLTGAWFALAHKPPVPPRFAQQSWATLAPKSEEAR